MSETLLSAYNVVRDGQRDLNEARRIRTKINDARGSKHDAGVRWPFELLQNALDAGPRNGQEHVEVRLRRMGRKFVFEHDGAAFSLRDLAALLSGGSSKEFDSEKTTGRFGTGFLVTHVLAAQTRVSGILNGESLEHFSLLLERSGDEDAIVRNIESCKDAVSAAVPIAEIDGVPSAAFEYTADDADALERGLASFRVTVPYLFATCSGLGHVSFEEDDRTESWHAEDATSDRYGDATLHQRLVSRTVDDQRSMFRVIRSTLGPENSSAIVVLEQLDTGWRVLVPGVDFPRVFCRYPIRSSSFLPINVVLDAPFDVDQERRRIHFDKDRVKALFHACLEASVALAEFAFKESWGESYALARAAPSPSSFGDTEDAAEKDWLTGEVREFAERIARLQLVDTRRGRGAAISENDWHVDFLSPRLTDDGDEVTTISRMWPLVDDDERLDPPVVHLAAPWSRVADGWSALGIEVSRITLESLAEDVRKDVEVIEELHVRCDKHEWLARFLDVVGECWDRKAPNLAVVDGLLSDQTGRLVPTAALKRDTGIPDALKDIAADLGIDVRQRLLDLRIQGAAKRLGLDRVDKVLTTTVPTLLTEGEIVNELVLRLEKALPDGKPRPDNELGEVVAEASVRLLGYLAERDHPATTAFRVPLLTCDGTIVRATQQRRMMAPVSTWDERGRAFHGVYPPDRVLDECYATIADYPTLVAALVRWRIAYPDPLVRDTPADLRDERLRSLAVRPEDSADLHVAGEEFSQIAMLHPELFNRCERLEWARALFGLVLTYIAPTDPEWRSVRSIQAKRGGAETLIDVRGALWLADLQWRAWVPIPSEGGKTSKAVASSDSLERMLDSNWLHENDAAVELLGQFFGFDALELRLHGAAPEPALRLELRNRIARLVEVAGADPGRYDALVADLVARDQRTRLVAQCRDLGLAVQAAIGGVIADLNLKVTLIDRGFDFEVESLEEAAGEIEVGSFFVEVKATTTGEAKLTPKQAETASSRADRYVLCVVDLRSVPRERLDQPWTPADVAGLARVVTDIGTRVQGTWDLVTEARDSEVALRNEGALRYAVPSPVWEQGCSISEWVNAAFNVKPE